MFLIKCPDCGRCGCECGKLPYTLTVTLDGLTNKQAVQGAGECKLSATACFGQDATAKIVDPGGCLPGLLNQWCDGVQDDRGPITKVVVTDGGSCYAKLGRVAPTIKAAVPTAGEEAELSVSLEEVVLGCDGSEDVSLTPTISHWKINKISVSGGTKYPDLSPVQFYNEIGDTLETLPQATLSASEGVPTEVTLAEAGVMYRESKDEPPYVASVSFAPGGFGNCLHDGVGQNITGVVDDDPESPRFGQVVSAEITNGGFNWLAWRWGFRCLEPLNGEPIVLRASDPHKLVTAELDACYGSGACIEVPLVGERQKPEIRFTSATGCGATFIPQVVEFTNAEGKKAWRLDSLAASGGAGYQNNSFLIVAFDNENLPGACGLMVPMHPAAFITTGVNGAITSANVLAKGEFYIEPAYDGNPSPIFGAIVTNGGSGYAKPARVEPTLSLFVLVDNEQVALPDFVIVLGQHQDDCGVDFWSIESVAAGEYEPLEPGQSIAVNVLIAAFSVEQKPASLRMHRDDEGVLSVDVTSGGEYYAEDTSGPAYVAQHTVFIKQVSPSQGSGAEIDVVIDDSPLSPTFGSVISATVKNQGSGYTLAGGPKDCRYVGPAPCEITLSRGRQSGDVLPLLLTLAPTTQGGQYKVFAALHGDQDEPLHLCDDVSGELSTVWGLPDSEVSATVETGGEWVQCSELCDPCPDLRFLCISASATDWEGNQESLECKDFFRERLSASGAFEGLSGGYSISITCQDGLIDINVAANPDETYDPDGLCGQCTFAFASGSLVCGSSETWYLGTVSLVLQFDNEQACEECPPLGVVNVTIGAPPC